VSAANRTELSGVLAERGSLRYTPAGVPVIEFRITHSSEQIEAELPRRVECELACVSLGNMALLLKDVQPGIALTASGFISARSLKQKTPVLHVTSVEFTENICTD
jgi:primosomal replication protein N